MALDKAVATESLIRQGWSDADIDTTLEQINQEEENLIRQGKSDQEIDALLSKTQVLDREGNPFNLFGPAPQQPIEQPQQPQPMMKEQFGLGPSTNLALENYRAQQEKRDIVNQGLANIDIPPVARTLAQPTAQAQPSTMQKITDIAMAAPRVITEQPHKLVPFGGISEMMAGNPQYQTTAAALNPIPPLVMEALGEALNYIGSGRKGFNIPGTNIEITGQTIAKAIQDAMNAAPPLTGVAPGTYTRGAKYATNLAKEKLIGRPLSSIANAPVALETGPLIPENAQIRPITNVQGRTVTEPLTAEQSSIVEASRTPLEKPTIKTQSITPEEKITAASEAKSFGAAVSNDQLVGLANKTINDNGIIQPIETQPAQRVAKKAPSYVSQIRDAQTANDLEKMADQARAEFEAAPSNRKYIWNKRLELINEELNKRAQLKESADMAADLNIVANNKLTTTPLSKMVGPKFRHGTDIESATGIINEGLRPGSSISKAGGRDYEGYPVTIEFQDAVKSTPYSSPLGPTMHEGAATTGTVARDINKVFLDVDEFLNKEDAIAAYNELRQALDNSGRQNIKIERAKWIETPRGEKWKYGGKIDFEGIPSFQDTLTKMSDKTLQRTFDETLDTLIFHEEKQTGKQAKFEQRLDIITNEMENRPSFAYLKEGIVKQQLADITSEPKVVGTKVIKEKPFSDGKTGLTDEQAFDRLDISDADAMQIESMNSINAALKDFNIPRAKDLSEPIHHFLPEEVVNSPRNANVGNERLRDAVNVGGDWLNDLNDADLEIQIHAKFVPYHRVANKIENETGLPILTEFYDKGEQAFNRKMHLSLKENKEVEGIFGKYAGWTNKNIRARERIADYIEDIQSYDRSTGDLVYLNRDGNIQHGSVGQMAANRGAAAAEVKVAADMRNWFAGAMERGAPGHFWLDFYLPKRWERTGNDRFAYFGNLRDEEKAFFQFHRTNAESLEPPIRDPLILARKYINEWGTVTETLPWQRDVAEPILRAVTNWQNSTRSMSTEKPARFIAKFTRDIMGIPRTAANDVNYSMYKIVRDYIEPFTPKLAEDIYNVMSKERIGERLQQYASTLMYKNVLNYRPKQLIRNFTNRIMAAPLLPNGLKDIGYGMKVARSAEGKIIAGKSGITGHLSDVIERNPLESPTVFSKVKNAYQLIEDSNRLSVYIPIMKGIAKDYIDGVPVGQMAEKWRLKFYPEAVAKRIKTLYEEGRVGDISQPNVGIRDNAAHLAGDWAQKISQGDYSKGAGPEIFNTGPAAKIAGSFTTWHFHFGSYLSDLIRHSYKSPGDLFRVAKMFTYLTVLDILPSASIVGQQLGFDLQSNPITNLPTRLAQSPLAQAPFGAMQAVSGTMNYLTSKVLEGVEDDYAKREASEGFKKLGNFALALVPYGMSYAARDVYRMAFPKPPKEPKGIEP